MTLGFFLAWVIVMALAIASYVWLVVVVVRASRVPRDWKWAVLVPPAACWVGIRAGGWPRAASITFALLASTYVLLRILP
ncbi:MAG: hypothetical protein J0L92_13535 [Deltaproteobacteria bacterium]|nr:hypothetical protein [Deltaproteobacteria bacterium]